MRHYSWAVAVLSFGWNDKQLLFCECKLCFPTAFMCMYFSSEHCMPETVSTVWVTLYPTLLLSGLPAGNVLRTNSVSVLWMHRVCDFSPHHILHVFMYLCFYLGGCVQEVDSAVVFIEPHYLHDSRLDIILWHHSWVRQLLFCGYQPWGWGSNTVHIMIIFALKKKERKKKKYGLRSLGVCLYTDFKVANSRF